MRSAGITSKSLSTRSDELAEAPSQSLLLCVVALMGLGLILVYSASFIYASETFGDGLFFFKRQLIFTLLAGATLFVTSRTPYNTYRKLFWPLFAILIVSLLAVFIPGVGHRAGGASRWLNLPLGFHFEPGEFAKFMSPIIFSNLILYERKKNEGWWIYYIKAAVVVLLPVAIMLKQPDFGSSVIFFAVGLTLLFCFGLKWRYVIGAVIAAIPAFYFLVMRVDYRYKRVVAFLNPWADPANSGFQVIQSLLSFHAGGLWGTGIGKGQGKLFFLPEAHTDFILAVLGEETGFIGLVLVMILFGTLLFRGLQIAINCKEPFGRRLALGITTLIGLQIVVNAGVVLGLLPTKGLTMPFLSYGGSSLIIVSVACGILVNIQRRTSAAKL